MALIQFNPQNLHVQVIVGIQEKFEPSDETNEIYARATALREKLAKLQNKIIKPEIDEITKLVNALNLEMNPKPKPQISQEVTPVAELTKSKRGRKPKQKEA